MSSQEEEEEVPKWDGFLCGSFNSKRYFNFCQL